MEAGTVRGTAQERSAPEVCEVGLRTHPTIRPTRCVAAEWARTMTQDEMKQRLDLEVELPPGTRLRIIRSPDWHRWPQGMWLSVEDAYALILEQFSRGLPSGGRTLETFRRDLTGLTSFGVEPFAFAIVRPSSCCSSLSRVDSGS